MEIHPHPFSPSPRPVEVTRGPTETCTFVPLRLACMLLASTILSHPTGCPGPTLPMYPGSLVRDCLCQGSGPGYKATFLCNTLLLIMLGFCCLYTLLQHFKCTGKTKIYFVLFIHLQCCQVTLMNWYSQRSTHVFYDCNQIAIILCTNTWFYGCWVHRG